MLLPVIRQMVLFEAANGVLEKATASAAINIVVFTVITSFHLLILKSKSYLFIMLLDGISAGGIKGAASSV